MVIAVDGPAGAGKSTVSRLLAARLAYRYVDTGAMYRVIGVLAAERGIDPADEDALADLCDTTLMEFRAVDDRVCIWADGRDLSAAIRTPEAAQWASKVSAVAAVRTRLVACQRQLGAGGGVVMEGRDIGTVVFPEAPLKIFLDAAPGERARRRAKDLRAAATATDIARMAEELAERDARDRSRTHAPLRPAADAIVVDTTGRTVEETVRQVADLARARAKTLASGT